MHTSKSSMNDVTSVTNGPVYTPPLPTNANHSEDEDHQ